MSRLGIWNGNKYLFTHHDPHTGRYWTDEIKDGMWIDSRNINFNVDQPKKTKSRFTRKERI
jgi:hypothetical protein